ncbi:MAG: hypothetical protein LAN71_17035 [Acidobacteriia bacterium]|nr:hypothetical protein [Terriglobia bacterium]
MIIDLVKAEDVIKSRKERLEERKMSRIQRIEDGKNLDLIIERKKEQKRRIEEKNKNIQKRRIEERNRIEERKNTRKLIIKEIEDIRRLLGMDIVPSIYRLSINNLKIMLERLKEKKGVLEPFSIGENGFEKLELIDFKDMKKGFSKSYIEYKNIIRSYEKVQYWENPNCPLFIDVIKRQVESVFDKITEINGNRDRYFDFILDMEGKRFKVKHLTSGRQIRHGKKGDIYFWEYEIGNNKDADAFLLSAFDDRESLGFQHLWFVKSRIVFVSTSSKVRNGKKVVIMSKKKFWNRNSLSITDSKEKISDMEGFELKKELQKLKSMKYDDLRNEHKSAVRLLLYEKQQDILDATNIKKSIGYLAESSIELGLEKLGKIFELKSDGEDNSGNSANNVVQKMLKKRLREEKGKEKGLLQEEYENDIYNLIIERQKELSDIMGENRSIKEVMEEAIESGIKDVCP